MSAIERGSAKLVKYSFSGPSSNTMRFVVVDCHLISGRCAVLSVEFRKRINCLKTGPRRQSRPDRQFGRSAGIIAEKRVTGNDDSREPECNYQSEGREFGSRTFRSVRSEM